MSNIQKIREATQACLAKAQELYGVDMSDVVVRFDLKGVAAGMAGYQGRFGKMNYYLRFNTVMIAGEGFDHVLNDTVPHEIAHMVCFKNPKLGSGHNGGWARVCRELGGTGKRCHDEEVVYAKGRTYEYTCTKGTKQRFSEARHKKIQRGVTYSLRRGGQIHKGCEYEVVGISGRPVNVPKQVAAKRPVEPEQIAASEPVAAPKPAAKAAPKLKKESKAERVRNVIRKCKANGEGKDVAEAFAVNILGMKAAMARRYVSENWDRA